MIYVASQQELCHIGIPALIAAVSFIMNAGKILLRPQTCSFALLV
jgi:hypothetical protein